MTTPTLKTVRLSLVAPILNDNMELNHYLSWLHNEAVVKFSEQRHKTHTHETQYEYLRWFPQSGEDFFWEIQRNSTPIGSISAYCYPANRTASVGVMIGDTRLWGNGYASEAWSGVCAFLFEQGTRKIEGGCMAANHAMVRLLEKQGFEHEATIPNHFLLNGNPEDEVRYGKYNQAKIIPIKEEGPTSFRR